MCVPICQLLPSVHDCMQVPTCAWEGVCKLRCAFQHFDEAECEADVDCFWNAVDERCENSCSNAPCELLPLCGMNGTVCVPSCAMAYSASQCEAQQSADPERTKCVWSATFTQCDTVPQAAPTKHFTEIQCNNTACQQPGCFSNKLPLDECVPRGDRKAESFVVTCVTDSSGVPIVLNVTAFTASATCTGSSKSSLIPLSECLYDDKTGNYVEFMC